jgi:hypothetical protein
MTLSVHRRCGIEIPTKRRGNKETEATEIDVYADRERRTAAKINEKT